MTVMMRTRIPSKPHVRSLCTNVSTHMHQWREGGRREEGGRERRGGEGEKGEREREWGRVAMVTL